METYIIAIDAGKHRTKAVGKRINDLQPERISFKTKLYNLENGDIDLQGESHLVEYEDQQIIIGEQGEEIDNTTSKTSQVHKLAIYTAITQFISPGEVHQVNIVIGCPTAIFKNKGLKEEYRNYIRGDGYIDIQVDGQQYSFVIERIVVKCEGSGIVYVQPELFKGKKVGLIDLGGRNLNFGVYENLAAKATTMFSSDLGSMTLEADLKDELTVLLGDTVDADAAARAIQEGGLMINGSLDQRSVEVVKRAKRSYFRKVQQEIKAKGINLTTMDVVAVGGTSLAIQDEIKEAFQHATIPTIEELDAQWASVEGFYRVGLVKFK